MKSKPSMGILQGLVEKAYRDLIPLSCLFEVTRKCNLTCSHCYASASKKRKEMSFPQVMKALSSLRRAGTLYMSFTGGEPFTRADFPDIIKRAVGLGFSVSVFSNGLLIDGHKAELMGRLGVSYVGLSMYGARPSTHDRATGMKGSFKGTLAAARRLIRAGVPVVFKILVLGSNEGEYDAMIRLAKKTGAGIQVDPTITPRDDSGIGPCALRPSMKAVRKVFRDRRIEGFKPGRERPGEGHFECAAGRSVCAVNAYGDLLACVQIPVAVGSVIRGGVLRAWKSSAFLRKLRAIRRKDIATCRECPKARACLRCPGLALVEDGSLFGPSSEACRQAEVFSGRF